MEEVTGRVAPYTLTKSQYVRLQDRLTGKVMGVWGGEGGRGSWTGQTEKEDGALNPAEAT